MFIYNNSICGANSEHIVDKLLNTCKHSRPNIIIIAIGTNDSRRQNGEYHINQAKFQSNLNKIVHIGKDYTPHIIFVWLTYVNETETNPVPRDDISYTNNDIIQYDQIIQNFAQSHQLGYIPLHDLLNNDYLDDGLHPNARWHQKIFERVLTYLQDNKFI